MSEHPAPEAGLDLDVFLHVIQCDGCTAVWGDERIAAYGNTLLQATIIMSNGAAN
jgi:hypothetical protein